MAKTLPERILDNHLIQIAATQEADNVKPFDPFEPIVNLEDRRQEVAERLTAHVQAQYEYAQARKHWDRMDVEEHRQLAHGAERLLLSAINDFATVKVLEVLQRYGLRTQWQSYLMGQIATAIKHRTLKELARRGGNEMTHKISAVNIQITFTDGFRGTIGLNELSLHVREHVIKLVKERAPGMRQSVPPLVRWMKEGDEGSPTQS